MTWAVYIVLTDESPAITTDWLKDKFFKLFNNEPEFKLRLATLPFHKEPSIELWFGQWLARISCEEGAEVQVDSIEIQRIVGTAGYTKLGDSSRRVRVVFSKDDDCQYTNHISGFSTS